MKLTIPRMALYRILDGARKWKGPDFLGLTKCFSDIRQLGPRTTLRSFQRVKAENALCR